MKLTMLIPAYKPRYLVELFTGLVHQSRRPDRIIVSDDSPRGAYSAMQRADPIGPRRGSSYANERHLIAHSSGNFTCSVSRR